MHVVQSIPTCRPIVIYARELNDLLRLSFVDFSKLDVLSNEATHGAVSSAHLRLNTRNTHALLTSQTVSKSILSRYNVEVIRVMFSLTQHTEPMFKPKPTQLMTLPTRTQPNIH